MTPSGQRIRALRTAKGWTIEELGDRANIDRSAMTNIENGASLGEIRARRIANALGVELEAVWQPREDDAYRRDLGGRLRSLEERAARSEAVLERILNGLDDAGIVIPAA